MYVFYLNLIFIVLQVFCPDVTQQDLHKIVNRIMDLYDSEKIVNVPRTKQI